MGGGVSFIDGHIDELKHKETIIEQGEYTIVQATNNHISLYKNGGFVMHINCSKKMTEEELLKQIDFYEKMANKRSDNK